MDAIVWLLDTISLRLHKKMLIIHCVLSVMFVIALQFMEMNFASCFCILCMGVVMERIFFDEIAKNNVIPLIVICGEKTLLVKLFSRKAIRMEAPYLFVVAIISVGWNLFHCAGIAEIFLTLLAEGIFWSCRMQCAFLHFGLMFFNNKVTTWFEMAIFVVQNLVFLLAQLLNFSARIAVCICGALLMAAAIPGKRLLISKGRRTRLG